METHIRTVKTGSPTLADWANNNRRNLVITVSAVVAVAVVAIAGWAIYSSRSNSAQEQFGNAMQTYDAAVVAPGTPSAPGIKSFPTSEERAKAANAEFTAVAEKYGMTPAGRNAKYMAAVTASEMGQTATAEKQLKDLADSWNSDVASLANLSLAQLYHNTGRDSEAIAIYDKLTKKPSTSVPAGLAQLQLAALYEADNKPAEARKVYAQLKDKEKDSPIGQLAAQKLNGGGNE